MTLTGVTWDHPRGYDPLIACSALYEKLFGLKVLWQKRSLTDFGDQSLSELADKFDLLVIDHPHIGIARETNCLVSFDEVLSQQMLDELKAQSGGPSFLSYHYKEKQWALPVDAAMQCSAYRPDLMATLDLPKSWSEVFDLATQLKKKQLQIGTALCPTDSVCSFLSITAQLGSPIEEGNEIMVDRETGLRSLDLLRNMRDVFHKDSLGWNPIQLYEHMSTHDDIAYAPLGFCYTNYSRKGFRRKLLNYGNAPGINNALLGGAGIGISATSKYISEAAQYAAWICSAAIQNSIYVSEQGQPANILAWENDFANGLTGDFFLRTIDTLAGAYVRPRYSGWPAFQKYLGDALHDFLIQDSDPEKVLDQLQEAYRQSYLKDHV